MMTTGRNMQAVAAAKKTRHFQRFMAVMMCGSALALASCAKDRVRTGAISANTVNGQEIGAMNPQQLGNTIQQLGLQYSKRPNDKTVAIAYATALRTDNRNDQSLAVMRRLAIGHPEDRDVLSAYGKALASNGQFEAALDAVQRAQTPEYPDWRLLSAEGAILDQIGNSDAARVAYKKALQINPGESSILSNLGMSHLLTGELGHAESYLRQAMDRPGADSRVRQNLALVVGLQGRFNEAMQIAQQELAPQQAEANVAFLKQMLSQQNAWKDIKDKKKS